MAKPSNGIEKLVLGRGIAWGDQRESCSRHPPPLRLPLELLEAATLLHELEVLQEVLAEVGHGLGHLPQHEAVAAFCHRMTPRELQHSSVLST